MTKIVLFLSLICSLAVVAAPVKWYDGKNAVAYRFMTERESVVDIALGMFYEDMESIAPLQPPQRGWREKIAPILVYQLDRASNKQRKELKSLGIDVDFLNTTADAFQIKVTINPSPRSGGDGGGLAGGLGLLIVGSNGRGAAYGLLELSRMAGVTPWVWWGDVVPEKKTELFVDSELDIKQKASVEMRGIFLNDEDWSLLPWAEQTMEQAGKGIIGVKTYRKIFELLLRLRANTIWPAMHPCTKAFFQTPGVKALADSCGIFIGTSHCEPLLRNNVGEWDIKERGAFNYITNKAAVQQYWTERLQEVRNSKTNIFTIGMRGIHDGLMEGVKTMDEKFAALQQVIDDQQVLLKENIGEPSALPQVFVPYKEVLELYERGLRVPDYVTLMWCDDNYGYLTRLSTPEEQKRSGGAGVYYHLSYWGRPHDYLWLTTTQPGLIYNEMRAAYDHNARKLWIANVHDPKIAGYQLELFLDMAWNIDCVSASAVGEHYRNWLCQQFGEDVGNKLYPAMCEYFRLVGQRRPEHFGWNQVELDKKKYPRGISPITGTELSGTAFGNELQRYLDSYEAVTIKVASLLLAVRPELREAYYARIFYPVCASAAQAMKVLEAQKGDSISSGEAYEKIVELTKRYNELCDGKWKGLMDMAPRRLPVFERLSGSIDSLGTLTTLTTLTTLDCHRDFIARFASSFTTKGPHCVAIDLLGHSLSAVSIPKGETLTFDFTVEQDGEAILKTALIPTQPNDGGDIRYAVVIDGGAETVFSLKEPFRSERWKLNVLRNQAIREQRVHLSKGHHTLTIRALDDHIILDQWLIDFNLNREPYYLIPQ